MASKSVQNITRVSGFFDALHPLAGISLFLPLKRLSLRAVSGALARSAFSHTQSHP
nr:MAG TPA: peptidyl-prolyl cis-transisomerase [Caudoviricetes sp.]